VGGLSQQEHEILAAESAIPSNKPLKVNSFQPYISWILSLFFGLLGLRGLSVRDLHSDAPNHLLNGALIADWIRSGQWADPVGFAIDYYGRLPATTIPFHPPGFPAIEGLFFLIFGARVEVARLVIALMVALAAFLFHRLVVRTCGSEIVAASATVVFFSLPQSTYLAGNVMLEMPTLVFMLAALYQLHRMDEGLSPGRALAYAAMASIALWTKQQAVFLGLMPFAYIVLARRWRLLARKEIWLVAAVFGSAVLAFTALTSQFSGGSGGAQEIPRQAYIARTFSPRAVYYLNAIVQTLGWIPAVWVGLAYLYALRNVGFLRRDTRLGLYLAWAPCFFATLFLTGHLDQRYLFFLYPPLIVLGLLALERAGSAIFPARWAWCAPVAVAGVCLAAIPSHSPRQAVRGPAEAADHVAGGRILYCGKLGTGNFVFSVRSRDPKLQSIVIRADSLDSKFTAADIDQFARRYGIDFIVAPQPAKAEPCDALRAGVPPTMVLKSEVPLQSSDANQVGSIKIYRYTSPSPDPERNVKIRVRKLRRHIEVGLEP
jgi:hypothetical protein